MRDYVKLYWQETYLFEEVGPKFKEKGHIDPVDFYLILVWKANRAKTIIRDRLCKDEKCDFADIVKAISNELRASKNPKQRLEILMSRWKFALPMASAILTVLYPQDFTVYDVRVCEQLEGHRLGNYRHLAQRKFSDELWATYSEFVNAVDSAVTENLSLRDKDRWLWARSFYEQASNDVKG